MAPWALPSGVRSRTKCDALETEADPDAEDAYRGVEVEHVVKSLHRRTVLFGLRQIWRIGEWVPGLLGSRIGRID